MDATKRPWAIGEQNEEGQICIYHNAEPYYSICAVNDYPDGEANAHLIVTAVNHFEEMREAINQFVTAYEHRPSHLGNGQARQSFEKFRALLAKIREG